MTAPWETGEPVYFGEALCLFERLGIGPSKVAA